MYHVVFIRRVMMLIKTRCQCDYINIEIFADNITIDEGFHNKQQAQELKIHLLDIVDEISNFLGEDE